MKKKIILFLTLIGYAPFIFTKAIPISEQSKHISQKVTHKRSRPARGIIRKPRHKKATPLLISREFSNTPNRPQPIFAKTLSHFVTPPKENELDANSYIWEDIAPIPFDELIISWNAKRPEQGHITFWTSVQCGSQWSPWHRMSSWGATKQRSFVNKLHQHVHTKHVRVELQRNQSACAFRVKAVFHDGATIDNLHAIFACCSYQSYFKPTSPYANYPSYCIQGIPRISQMLLDHHRYQDLCAPTSLSMVTTHFNQKFSPSSPTKKDEIYNYALTFADKVHDYGIDIYGNWQLNAAQAYDACQGNVFFKVERLNSFDDIYALLQKDIPVIVSVRRLKGGATPYAHGHILVVVGWNQNNRTVICLDPAFKGKVTRAYPLSHFSRAWALSKNFSYVAIPKTSIENPA